MLNPTKSVLLKTSASTDVQCVGGEVRILGLDEPVKQSRIVNISQANYRAEVAQVVTVGGSAYTPVALTTYTVTINDPNRRDAGLGEQPFTYSYKTSAGLVTEGATAALQREYIHAQLVLKINAVASNYVIAASLLTGTGFTITDDAGYYPYAHQGANNREGASTIKVKGGFLTTDLVLTTAAVYQLGVGAELANFAPVMDYATGNLISGKVNAPVASDRTYAVAGQKYNVFNISYFSDASLPTISSEYRGFTLRNVQVWVDNGVGSAVTNLAGYLAFEKRMHLLMAEAFKKDLCTVAEFFDKNFVLQGPLGAVPATTTSLTNKFLTPYGLLEHVNIGTQTIVAPSQGATGLLLDQDVATGDGAQYSPSLATANAQEFVVGKTAFMAIFNYTATAVTGVNAFFGFRNKEAFALDFNDYTQLAVIGSNSTSGKFSTAGILANAATVITTSASVGLVNSVKTQYIVKVDINGVVTCLANGVAYPVYSAGTTPLVLAAGTIMIPYFQTTQITGTASVGVIDEMLAVATNMLIS